MRRILTGTMLGLALCLAFQAQAEVASSPRVALVIGIGAYEHVARISNPPNDARLIAGTLRQLGFVLVGGGAQVDLDKPKFDRAVQGFGRALVGAEVGLFYYAGHGLQVQGTNWLVPVEADPARPQDLDFQMVDAGLVLRQMDGAGTKLNLLILDACRNNPFGGRGLRTADGGLGQMRAPEGTLIAYATQPGNVAMDGNDGHSPFSEALAKAMMRPGLDVFRLFNLVGLEVKRETGGDQQPWISSSPIDGDFYFSPASAESQLNVLSAQPPSPATAPRPQQSALLSSPNAAVPFGQSPSAASMAGPGIERALQEGQLAEARRDYGMALAWYRRGAEAGSADAAFDLGWLYQNGLGVPAEPEQASRWYRRAAEVGHVMAANNLGVLYKNGTGVQRDYAEALRWYRKAADAGNAEAENNIGVMYEDGLGVAQDAEQARRWFTWAAQQGNVSAEVNLGFLYKSRVGVEQDYATALFWFRRAADAGSAAGALNLGLMYENGLGMQKDHAGALTWIRRAAAQGDPDAQRLLQAFGDQ